MGKDLSEMEYEELSEILQVYLDRGETRLALEYCEAVAQIGNAYGYMFMGFIYEEGHGVVEVDYKKALWCYKKADQKGCDMKEDIVRVKEKIKKFKKIKLFEF